MPECQFKGNKSKIQNLLRKVQIGEDGNVTEIKFDNLSEEECETAEESETDVDKLLSENNYLKTNLRNAKAKNNDLKKSLRESKAENYDLKKNLRESKAEINELKATLEEVKEWMKNMPQV